ncbi:transglutaminase TgpA family protein [Arenicella xantha]|uniref:Uncharacterized protein DUF4129 n=1 Tax=Arenicella xantha TaxID=644221 RepID=A0A395JF24_9GAMM|nr:DUF3488 and transglutaminase-like domain-containing protein [Arenicella xantha]RBP48325.1 uncharacterized protein DUF4129 [Arenicella xantha]
MSILKRLGIKLPPLPSQPPTHEPHRQTLIQLSVIIGVAALMHFQIADPIIGFFALAVYTLKLTLIITGKNAPHRVIMMVLSIVSLVAIVALYGGWNGQRAGISFLVLLATLKFLESRGLRDYFVVCLILYFLAASSFLFDSSILSITVVLIYTLAITGILFQLSNPTPQGLFAPFKSSTMLVVKAVPIAILLFFFFPRIQGDFGFLPSQDELSSELSDSLVAGEMAASAFDNSLAFRVEFDDSPPISADRYWRVKVMNEEQNFTWKVSEPNARDFQRSRALQAAITPSEDDIRYQVLHEQTTDHYLPYLDYITEVERGKVLFDFSVFQSQSSSNKFRYRGGSNLTPPVFDQQVDRDRLLRTDSQPSARLQALMAQWRDGAESDADIIARVYQHIENTDFSYSLNPPGLSDENKIEDFLLNTKTGYCEHYASAFTIIMRWMGIPARVVVGYQGGRFNDAGDFLEVRYSDAHAWSEVWVNQRWQRVDPTAAISPERIEFGMDALLQLWDGDGLGGDASGRALADFLNPSSGARLMRNMRDSWNNISYQWNKWIVEYDFETQKELLKNLGIKSENSLSTLVALMFSATGALIVFYFWRLMPRRIKRSDAQLLYLKFVAKLAKLNINKRQDESPQEFSDKACREAPHLKHQIEKITDTYHAIRFGPDSTDPTTQLLTLRRLVKKFNAKHKN